MLFILISLVFFENADEQAIRLPLGTLPINVPLVELADDQVTNLKEINQDTFFFLLSPNCGFCPETFILAEHFYQKYDVKVLFVGDAAEIPSFMNQFKEPILPLYRVTDTKPLESRNIKILPALLAYKDGKLQLAMHGPLARNHYDMVTKLYEEGYEKPTTDE